MTVRVALLLLPFALTALGQRISFGVIGGVNATRDFPISRSLYEDPAFPGGLTAFDVFSDVRSPQVGFSVEARMGRGLSVEIDAIQRRLDLQRRLILPGGEIKDNDRLKTVVTWQYPILLKYRLSQRGAVRPFVEGGPSFRTRHDPAPAEPSQLGGTLGAGVEWQWGRVRFSPAVRYTRWQYDGDYPRFATKRDQIELVAGLSYATTPGRWHLAGRPIRFGVTGGTPLTKSLTQPRDSGESIDEVQGYLGGFLLGLEIHDKFSIDVNGLYRPIHASSRFTFPDGQRGSFEFTILTWQVPVLARYRFAPMAGRWRPFAETGPTLRWSGNTNGYTPSRFGWAAGGGLETGYGGIKIGPSVRYTRWAADRPPRWAPGLTKRNQMELLVSLVF